MQANFATLQLEPLLLHRDGLVLVLNKPYGLPVHPGPKGGICLSHLLPQLSFGLPKPPELAHRLDRETSGCLVLGRHRKALQTLQKLFSGGHVSKTYWAIVEGGPEDDSGDINLPLGPRDKNRGWWMKVDAAGQPSLTRYQVLGRSGNHCWLALEPVTGRTHQLRVHCAAMGWPIVGDAIYGTAGRFSRDKLHLYARAISFAMKASATPITCLAPPPGHMLDRLATLGHRETQPEKAG